MSLSPFKMSNYIPTSNLQIQPGQALGPLVLSSSLYVNLSSLISHKSTFPRLNISFNSSSPVSNPIYLDLEANGVRLRFSGESQQLELIEVVEFGKLGLLYGDTNLRYYFGQSWLTIVVMGHLLFVLFIRPLDQHLREKYSLLQRHRLKCMFCPILE